MQNILSHPILGSGPARHSQAHRRAASAISAQRWTVTSGKPSSVGNGRRWITSRKSVIAHGLIEKVSADELEVLLADRDKPLVIDFFATWCGPCVLLATELEKVASELGDSVKIVKVDVDENRDLASQLQVEMLPTLVLIPLERGKTAVRTEGLLDAATIKRIVTTQL